MRVTSVRVLSFFALTSSAMSESPRNERMTVFLEDHCIECHDSSIRKGGLNIEDLPLDSDAPDITGRWAKIHDRLAAGEMPPKKKDAPPAAEKSEFLESLSGKLVEKDRIRIAREGRSTWRRLNRFEYENTMRELLGAPWLRLKDMLPEDGEAYRFNKSGKALDISHVQLGRYMEAADLALRNVIATGVEKPKVETRRFYTRDQRQFAGHLFGKEFTGASFRMTFPMLGTTAQPDVLTKKAPVTVGAADPKTRELEALGVVASNYEPLNVRFTNFIVPRDGRYKLRFMAQTFTAGHVEKKPGLEWVVDRTRTFPGKREEPVLIYAVKAPDQRRIGGFDVSIEPAIDEIDVILNKGEIIAPDAARLYRPRMHPWYNPLASANESPGVAYRWMEVEGPIVGEWPGAGHQLLFGDLPLNASDKVKSDGAVLSKEPEVDAKRLLTRFLAKAYRRPVETTEIERFLQVFRGAMASGSHFTDAMIAGYTAVLCSPGFLVLEENPGTLDGPALASRLSYFLWNSPPDDTLRDLAASGKITEPAVILAQTERLLDDPKSKRFVNAFLDYWLDLRKIEATSPDSNLYPDYYLDDLLTESAVSETQLFFAEMVRSNLPSRLVIDSNFTFVNERLADHYGIPGVKGVAMRRVAIPENSPRGGLLTQASVLKVTANGTTTSPVLRGHWIMERILGKVTPPPPPGTPAVEPDIRGATTIRQQLDKHRDNPSCASCHSKIDPPGFALESFDVLGGWRDRYRAIDPSRNRRSRASARTASASPSI